MSMSKTGKKLKSVDCDNIDLTFNEIYDVFIDSEEYEFIIDDVGDKRYVYVHDKDCYELVDDVDLDKEWFMSDCTKSNYTKSNYTKTGKKVKCIDSKRTDLTYKKVYDVFVDNDGYEFVIDEAGDRRYDSMEFPLWREVFDDVAEATNTANNVSTTNKTKPKFKVGDKVKVVDIGYIYNTTDDVELGDVGVIVDINNEFDPYQVKFNEIDKDCWWFTESDLELVSDGKADNNSKTPIKSDGGSSSYYAKKIPPQMLDDFNSKGVIEAKDVMRLFLGNDFNMSNVFKAYCRVISLRNGEGKEGVTELYDLNKAVFFAQDELDNYLKSQPSDGSD